MHEIKETNFLEGIKHLHAGYKRIAPESTLNKWRIAEKRVAIYGSWSSAKLWLLTIHWTKTCTQCFCSRSKKIYLSYLPPYHLYQLPTIFTNFVQPLMGGGPTIDNLINSVWRRWVALHEENSNHNRYWVVFLFLSWSWFFIFHFLCLRFDFSVFLVCETCVIVSSFYLCYVSGCCHDRMTEQPPPQSFEALNVQIPQPLLICMIKFSMSCGGEDSVDWGLSQPIPA